MNVLIVCMLIGMLSIVLIVIAYLQLLNKYNQATTKPCNTCTNKIKGLESYPCKLCRYNTTIINHYKPFEV